MYASVQMVSLPPTQDGKHHFRLNTHLSSKSHSRNKGQIREYSFSKEEERENELRKTVTTSTKTVVKKNFSRKHYYMSPQINLSSQSYDLSKHNIPSN